MAHRSRSTRIEFVIIAFLTLALTNRALASCYFPNGTDRNTGMDRQEYTPCQVSGGSASMCCRLNYDNPDICLSNGLCQNPRGPTWIWRESCTDKTWTDLACIKLCLRNADSNEALGLARDELVTQCSDGTYCCGSNNRSCCTNHGGYYLVNGTAVLAQSADSLSSMSLPSATTTTISTASLNSTSEYRSTMSTPSPSSTVTNSAYQETPLPPVNVHSKDHLYAIIGGVVAGLIILVTLLSLIWLYRRRKRQRLSEVKLETMQYNTLRVGHTELPIKIDSPVELDSRKPDYELDSKVVFADVIVRQDESSHT